MAALEGPAREIKLLLDHREDLVCERTRIQQRLRWLLHDRWPELELPAGCLDWLVWLDQAFLAGLHQRRGPRPEQVPGITRAQQNSATWRESAHARPRRSEQLSDAQF